MGLWSSPLLRRMTAPLRQASPGLYEALRRVRKRFVLGTSYADTGLEAYQVLAIERFRATCSRSLAGQRILEIGSDVEMRVLRALAGAGAREVVGINNDTELWKHHEGGRIDVSPSARLLDADAARLPFPDASFDNIFTVATLEHLLDPDAVLRELHRVLVPGGRVYAHFGPIWSSGKGHHVFAQVAGEEARHFDPLKNPIPDHAHLLLGREDMRVALLAVKSAPLTEAIVAWVYDSPAINRWFYGDYVAAFERSAFEVVSLVPEVDAVPKAVDRILRFRFPHETRFDVTNAEVVLAKR